MRPRESRWQYEHVGWVDQLRRVLDSGWTSTVGLVRAVVAPSTLVATDEAVGTSDIHSG